MIDARAPTGPRPTNPSPGRHQGLRPIEGPGYPARTHRFQAMSDNGRVNRVRSQRVTAPSVVGPEGGAGVP
jgi:hypothetical protein